MTVFCASGTCGEPAQPGKNLCLKHGCRWPRCPVALEVKNAPIGYLMYCDYHRRQAAREAEERDSAPPPISGRGPAGAVAIKVNERGEVVVALRDEDVASLRKILRMAQGPDRSGRTLDAIVVIATDVLRRYGEVIE